MKLPSTSTLVLVAAGCGIGTGVMALLFNSEREKMANKADFITQAVEIMKASPVTKELIGEELKVGQASLNDGWGRLRAMDARVKVPLQGERDNAFLYVYARRYESRERFKLYKLEATFGKIEGKKLLILDKTKDVNYDPAVDILAAESGQQKSSEKKPAVAKRPETKEEFIEQMRSWQPTR